jgi:hypothetical protein
MIRPATLIHGLTWLTFGLASPTLACPVCGFGQDGTASAYLMTAVVMSSLPLIMVGGMIYYLVRRTNHIPDDTPEDHH